MQNLIQLYRLVRAILGLKNKPAGGMVAQASLRPASISAIITRANGKIEDLGVITKSAVVSRQ